MFGIISKLHFIHAKTTAKAQLIIQIEESKFPTKIKSFLEELLNPSLICKLKIIQWLTRKLTLYSGAFNEDLEIIQK